MFQDRVIHFGKNLGDQGKCRSTKKLKSLIEVPYVAHLKEQSSEHKCEPFLCSVACSKTELSFRENIGRSGEGSFAEKAKIVGRSSLGSALESAVFKLQS